MQHYDGAFDRKNGRTLEEEMYNDNFKKQLALQNGFTNETYIVIDCRYSNFEYIKNNILNSVFRNLFDLNKINWTNIIKKSEKNIVKEVCELWNTGKYKSTLELSNDTKFCRSTIIGMLNKGTKIGWTNYDRT